MIAQIYIMPQYMLLILLFCTGFCSCASIDGNNSAGNISLFQQSYEDEGFDDLFEPEEGRVWSIYHISYFSAWPLFLVGFIGDILFLLTVLWDRDLRRSTSIWPLTAKTIIDIPVCIIFYWLRFIESIAPNWFVGAFINDAYCKIRLFIGAGGINVSPWLQFLVAATQFMAVVNPQQFRRVMSPRCVAVQIAIPTIIGYGYSALYFDVAVAKNGACTTSQEYTWFYKKFRAPFLLAYATITPLILTSVLIILTTMRLSRSAQRIFEDRIREERDQFSTTHVNNGDNNASNSEATQSAGVNGAIEQAIRKQHDSRMAGIRSITVTLLATSCVHMLLQLPYAICNIVYHLHLDLDMSVSRSGAWKGARHVTQVIRHISLVYIFFVFIALMPRFRRKFFKLMRAATSLFLGCKDTLTSNPQIHSEVRTPTITHIRNNTVNRPHQQNNYLAQVGPA